MVGNIQLGSFLINGSLVLVLTIGLAGWLILRLWLKGKLEPAETKILTSLYSNAFWVWLLLWKLSYVFTHPREVLSNPMSLIYYDGGTAGIWIASLVAGFTFWLSFRKKKAEIAPAAGQLSFYKNLLVLVIVMGLAAYSVYNYVNERSVIHNMNQQAGPQDIPIGIKKGQQAPDFELHGLDGSVGSLSDYRGNVVVVNFWASWCPPCRVEMPHMQRLYDEYSDKGVVVLGVNLTSTEAGADAVDRYVRDEDISFPIVMDSKGSIMDLYRVIAYPTTYIIDREGVIRDVFPGAMNMDMLKKRVRGL